LNPARHLADRISAIADSIFEKYSTDAVGGTARKFKIP
jgi:hypothetical protein